jgi:hypothetical protein
MVRYCYCYEKISGTQICVDDNEIEIVRVGGLEPIVQSTIDATDRLASVKSIDDYELYEELASQCARSLRNLSVNST